MSRLLHAIGQVSRFAPFLREAVRARALEALATPSHLAGETWGIQTVSLWFSR